MASWTPTSWRGKPSQQMAEYEDKAAATAIFAKLGKLPGLVQPAEVDRLRTVLAAAANGERFIIQGGDCAERFIDCEPDRLDAQLKLLLQMGAIVAQSTGLPSVNIARIAGRSAHFGGGWRVALANPTLAQPLSHKTSKHNAPVRPLGGARQV